MILAAVVAIRPKKSEVVFIIPKKYWKQPVSSEERRRWGIGARGSEL